MEVTERVTPTSIRLVVITSKNVLYVANLSEEQLQECITKYGLKWKRPRGSRAKLDQIESDAKENDNGDDSAQEQLNHTQGSNSHSS